MTPCKKCSQWRKNGNQWICIRCGKEIYKATLFQMFLDSGQYNFKEVDKNVNMDILPLEEKNAKITEQKE